MLKNDMWKIFEATGKIDAYLYCKIDSENKEKIENKTFKNEIESDLHS